MESIKRYEWWVTDADFLDAAHECGQKHLSLTEYAIQKFKLEVPCQITIRQIIDAPTVA